MGLIPSLKVWLDLEILTAPDLNSNFDALRSTLNSTGMFTDVARTITAVQTFSATPVFDAGVTINAGAAVNGGVTVNTGGVTVTAGGVTITAGGLNVAAGGFAVTGNSTITGNLIVSGTITGTLGVNVSAANVTAGTFPGASYTFANAVTIPALSASSVLMTGSWIRSTNVIPADVSGTVDVFVGTFGTREYRVTGPVTFNIINDNTTSKSTMIIRQDGVGGHSVAFSGTVAWPNATPPTFTTTAGRADKITLDGRGIASVLLHVEGQNYA